MINETLPPVLYYGTSSLYLAGILNSGLDPQDSFGGQLMLTADINKAIDAATTKTYFDATDGQLKANPNYRIVPIVCRVYTADLIQGYMSSYGSTSPLATINDNGGYVIYNDKIPVSKDNIEVVQAS